MDLGPWEIAIIAVVILVLFGSAKLPKAARSLGRSMRVFKAETKGLVSDDDDDEPSPRTTAQAAPATTDNRAEAARLREQAARLEREAGPQELNAPANDTAGVPLSQTEQSKKS